MPINTEQCISWRFIYYYCFVYKRKTAIHGENGLQRRKIRTLRLNKQCYDLNSAGFHDNA